MRALARAGAVACLFVAAAAAHAAASAEPWDVGQLMATLAAVRTSEARFVERKTLSLLDIPLESSGTLSWRAPDRLEKHTLEPREEHMLLEGDRLVVEVAGKPRQELGVQAYPVVRAFIESIRSTLAGDLVTLEKFYRVRLEGRPGAWTLVLVPRESRMRGFISEIRIRGARRIASIEIWEANGDRSLMTITEAGS